MNAEQIAKLKELALAATPGPWNWGGTPVSTNEEAMAICRENIEATEKPGTHFCEVYLDDGRRTALVGNGPTGIANAAFIAAANPAAILELIAMAEKQQIAEDAAKAIIAAIGDMPEAERTTAPVSLTDDDLTQEFSLDAIIKGIRYADHGRHEGWQAELKEYIRIECNRAILAAAPAPIQQEPEGMEDPIMIPRGLVGAACYLIRKHAPESNLLEKLRDFTTGKYATPPALAGSQVQAAGDAVDAARYRWLRDQDIHSQVGRFTPYAVQVIQGQVNKMLDGKELDAACDAAIREQQT